ncbi:uncharacterized protein LOC107849256 [Capsicum annuum]|uniref:uncharacterized protein LOC107849256 n=1 Tax=Capsicum annuum TaxID=4072 RepID=UPI001FB10D13|nr:uncharacterized protein LOC107849256 [Capsicum annuum]
MAKAYRKEDFEYIMSKVAKIDQRVKEYLEDAGYEKWSRCHSPVNRSRMMTSNIDECINGFLVEARKLSILGFLKEVRILFVAWNGKKNEIASSTNTTLERRFEEILTLNRVKALWMTVKPAAFVDDEEVLPPKYRRPPGSPKKERHLKLSESLSSSSNR